MSTPNRRRNPTISRGKKSDKKKGKRQKESQTSNLSPVNELAKITERAEQDREAMLIDNKSTSNRNDLFSEPSAIFYSETSRISNINIKNDKNLININATDYKFGIETAITKQERILVLNGRNSTIFNQLPSAFREKREEASQAKRKSQHKVLELSMEREKQNKIIAAREHEQKLLAKNKAKQETVRLAEIKLKGQQEEIERIRLAEQAIQETERLAGIKLKRQQKEREIIRFPRNDHVVSRRVEKPVEKKKQGVWANLLKSLLSIISVKGRKSRRLRPRAKQSGTKSSKFKTVRESDRKIKLTTEISTEELEISSEEPEIIIEEVEIAVEVVTEISAEEEESEISSEEPEIIIEEAEIAVEVVTEISTEEEESEISAEEPEIIIGREDLELPETDVIDKEKNLPSIETGEVILADLRIMMREEPSPIGSIISILKKNHNLSVQDANYLINHVVSPISICKELTDEQYKSIIHPLNNDNHSGEGSEIWTQVIQIIGPSSLTKDEIVDIHKLFTNKQNRNKIGERVITIALLLNALPGKFEGWWKGKLIPKQVSDKYAEDYEFYLGKRFPQEAVEEARMLICSCAIEKPILIFKEYNYAKHKGGKKHEDKTEKWLTDSNLNVKYLTQHEMKKRGKEHYGNKYINATITPDILLEVPIQLSEEGASIHWIDAKNHFVDPALSSDQKIASFCHQMDKYVRNYGPGLIIWGKDFSEEWNEATKGAVQHIKI